MIVEIGAAGSGMDEHETSPRGTGTYNTEWRLDYTARHTEKRRESFIIWPTFDRNFNLQMSKSFNLIYFFFHDPRPSESIRVDPSWSGPTLVPASNRRRAYDACVE